MMIEDHTGTCLLNAAPGLRTSPQRRTAARDGAQAPERRDSIRLCARDVTRRPGPGRDRGEPHRCAAESDDYPRCHWQTLAPAVRP